MNIGIKKSTDKQMIQERRDQKQNSTYQFLDFLTLGIFLKIYKNANASRTLSLSPVFSHAFL